MPLANLYFTGLAALAKVLVAMEERCIPANLHYNNPNPDIPGLTDGRLKVVANNTKWSGGYAGINSFGFGGSNVHALIRSNEDERRSSHPASNQPRLVTCNGRTEEAVDHVIEKAIENKENVEMHALIQEVAAVSPAAMPCRGYAVLNSENKVTEVQVRYHYIYSPWHSPFLVIESRSLRKLSSHASKHERARSHDL